MTVAPGTMAQGWDVAGGGIADVLARVDALLGRAVDACATPEATAPGVDALRGLFVSDTDAGRLVSRGPAPLAGRLGFELPLVDLASAGPQWRRLAAVFALEPVEVDILALALAAEVDLRYERIFGYLHDDLTRRRLTPDLACQLLCDSLDERIGMRRLFDPHAPLVRHALVHLVQEGGAPGGSLIGQAVRLDDGIIDWLLGAGAVDRRLAGAVYREDVPAGPLPHVPAATVEALLREERGGEGLHALLLGPDVQLQTNLARHVARELEQPLYIADCARLSQLEVPFAEAALVIARTALLAGGVTLWLGGDALTEAEPGGAARLEAWRDAVTRAGTTAHMLALREAPRSAVHHGRPLVTVRLPLPDSGERQRLWVQRLAEHRVAVADADAALLAEVVQLDGAAIDRALAAAIAQARWRDAASDKVTIDDLLAAARAQIVRSLPRYATRMEGVHRWEDIVLEADRLRQLEELCDRVRHRRVVLDEWGFGRRLTLGKGIAALFSGPSGTGKTMAAQIIAASLGMDLYRVEIPAVVSKYIGETEKALEQLFREAQGTSVILFFDEADALFGKRSEVKDAHDRYANIEISYLLQAIEQYDGLTILATNLRHNVDDAFVRRLAFAVSFPFPEAPERQRIWERSWPQDVPLAADIDAEFLARQFKLAGGNIRNVTLAAAYAAAADGRMVTMAHVVRAIRREFQKMGRVCVETDFGPYFPLLDQGSGR